MLSTTVHITLMTLALFASARLARKFEQAVPERLTIAQLSLARMPFARTPATAARRPRRGAVQALRDAVPAVIEPLEMRFEVLTVPLEIPDVLPDIDVLRAVTNEASFTGRGVAYSVAYGTVYGTGEGSALGAPPAGQPYRQSQVERVAAPAGGCTPRFPSTLSQAGIEGTVMVEFVIDTSGRAEPRSFKAVSSAHALFDRAVRSALRCMRFRPAEVGGRKVRQLVQQPFAFVLAR
ncbi:MAG TPA: energy transducer TonB [Gemmatimonadaceae bacterium]|nr:energy transducer TonB [Gemmatimonadaceae bacterium]